MLELNGVLSSELKVCLRNVRYPNVDIGVGWKNGDFGGELLSTMKSQMGAKVSFGPPYGGGGSPLGRNYGGPRQLDGRASYSYLPG